MRQRSFYSMHTLKTTRSLLTDSRQITNPKPHSLFDSSRPFASTRSFFNLHTSSTTLTISTRQLTTRPGIVSLGHGRLFPNLLLKRSSRCYARPGHVLLPHQRESRTLAYRRPLWSHRRYYNQHSHDDNTEPKFFGYEKSTLVVGLVIAISVTATARQWLAEIWAKEGDHVELDQFRQNFVNSVENIEEGRLWVMLTSSFAHVNLVHLGLNMFCIWGFGKDFVRRFGALNFAGFWVLTAFSCSAAQVYWQSTQKRLRQEVDSERSGSQTYTVLGIPISRERALAITGGNNSSVVLNAGGQGASGVACGLTGLAVCFAPRLEVQIVIIETPLWLAETAFVAGSLVCMATGSIPFIGHAGHLGGMAAGIAYYFGWMRPWLIKT